MDEQRFTNVSNWQIAWMLFRAPLMGALFVVFLPVIGFVLVGRVGLEKAMDVMRKRYKHIKHIAGVV